MAKTKRITAICGWAVPSVWFEKTVQSFFPECNVKAVYPNFPRNSKEAEQILQETISDLYIGYSMGSLWLLHHKNLIPEKAIKALIAPILSFIKEDKRGGKTASIQLLYLLKTLKRKPEESKPIINFFAQCNLSNGENLLGNIPENDILIEGLEFLRDIKVEGNTSEGFLSYMGNKDPFLETDLKNHIPHLEILSGCDHAPNKMLQALAQRLQWGI
jgi:hypothetical protein